MARPKAKPELFVYSTTDPATLATYRRVTAERATFSEATLPAALIELGSNGDIYGTRGTTGEPDEFTAVGKRDDGFIPAGWRTTQDGERITPLSTKAGEPARAWLAAHQPPDPLYALEQEHKLPRTVWVPHRSDGREVVTVEVFEHDGELWAVYPIEPGGPKDFFDEPCPWTRRPVDEMPVRDQPARVGPARGQFCLHHFSWLCQAGQGACQREVAANA